MLAVAGAAYLPPQPGGADRDPDYRRQPGGADFRRDRAGALAALPPELRGALVVSQQARPEDCDRVAAQFNEAGINAEISSFFTDIPARLARAQLVICRSGASTIAELASVGRPALLVPYPHATDDHQTANAHAFAGTGAAWVIPQPDFSSAMLTRMLGELLSDPEGLRRAAAQARRFAPDNAADRLARLVLGVSEPAGFAGEERAA